MSQLDNAVIQSVYRLFSSNKQAVWSEFLRKNITQEVIYDILCGSCGKQFLQSIIQIGQADEIYAANSWIKENFRHAFKVEKLAEQRNMSVSLFHQKFKSAVGRGPLQCQKRLRLTEARRLMLDDNKMKPKRLWSWDMKAFHSLFGITGICLEQLQKRIFSIFRSF